MKPLKAFAAAIAATFCAAASAQTKWDMPTPYPATNSHREHRPVRRRRRQGDGGKLKIQVHPGASAVQAPEIKRAVQSGPAQIGEILISATPTRTGVRRRSVPFLATSYAEAAKLWKARAGRSGSLRQAGNEGPLRGAVAAPGHLLQQADRLGGRHEGPQDARLHPATSKIAELVGAQPVTCRPPSWRRP